MKKALIIVDYQYDFVSADGALTVGKPAQDIEKKISALAEDYDEKDIYFTFDDHRESDWDCDIFPETKVFGKHCVKGTKGYAIYGAIKGMNNPANFTDKHAYCPPDEFRLQLVQQYDEITVVGVVTDICVFQTVIGLYTTAVNKGIKIKLIVDSEACASFHPEREKWALQYMKDILSVEVK